MEPKGETFGSTILHVAFFEARAQTEHSIDQSSGTATTENDERTNNAHQSSEHGMTAHQNTSSGNQHSEQYPRELICSAHIANHAKRFLDGKCFHLEALIATDSTTRKMTNSLFVMLRVDD